MTPLPHSFYARASTSVARALLGQRLVRMLDGVRLTGLICETEAYGGSDDLASHAFRRTPRSAIMYGPPGHAYVYFIYGMHHCLNVVTEEDGQPGAVLIRGLVPETGVGVMAARRGGAGERQLTDGPGKVCRALGVTLALNGADLTTGAELFIEPGAKVTETEIALTPRIGVRGDEAARGRLWRFVWRRVANGRQT